MALNDLVTVDDAELAELPLLGPLKALVDLINFRDPSYREIRVEARKAIAYGPFSTGACNAALRIVKELKERPALSWAPTPPLVITRTLLLDQISYGIKAILVEIAYCPLFFTVSMCERKSMNATKKSWKKVQRDLNLLIRKIIENFPKEQLLAIALANEKGQNLQRYIVDLEQCGLREIFPIDLQEKSVSTEFAEKLDEAISPKIFLESAPDGHLCSLCLEPQVKEVFDFIIVDACNHLFCVSCLRSHFTAPQDG